MRYLFLAIFILLNKFNLYSQNIVIKTDSIYKVYSADDGRFLLEANSEAKTLKNFKTGSIDFDQKIEELPFTKPLVGFFSIYKDEKHQKILRQSIENKTIYIDLRATYFRQEKVYNFSISNMKDEIETTLIGANFTYNPVLGQIIYERDHRLYCYSLVDRSLHEIKKKLETKSRMDGSFSWVWSIYNKNGDLWLYQASRSKSIYLYTKEGDIGNNISVDAGEESEIYLIDDNDIFWQGFL